MDKQILIKQEIMRLKAHFPTDRSAEDWQIVIDDYADELSNYDGNDLVTTFRKARNMCQFFPRLSELINMIGPKAAQRTRDQERLENIGRQFSERRSSPELPPVQVYKTPMQPPDWPPTGKFAVKAKVSSNGGLRNFEPADFPIK